MQPIEKLLDITSRLEHIENSAEWIARESVHTDNSISQTGTLISVLVDDVRNRINDLVKELEELASLDRFN